MKELLANVFDTYCRQYHFLLRENGFKPLNEKRGTFHESNQVRFFLNAYERQGGNIITWTELPVIQWRHRTKPKTAHIDGFIADIDRQRIFFIEAKRFSREVRIQELGKDIQRIFDIRDEYYVKDELFKGLNLMEFDAYAVALADLWMDNEEWKNKIYPNWQKKADYLIDPSNIRVYADEKEILPDYHLLYAVQPVFNVAQYKEEREESLRLKEAPADPDFVTYSDEFTFESCLADIRKGFSQ